MRLLHRDAAAFFQLKSCDRSSVEEEKRYEEEKCGGSGSGRFF